MNQLIAYEALFFDPVSPDWTIAEMLEWIGADDARCHDERLAGIMDAVCRALRSAPDDGGGEARFRSTSASVVMDGQAESAARSGRHVPRIVARVRELAMRVSVEPAVGAWKVGELIGVHREEAVNSADLATV